MNKKRIPDAEREIEPQEMIGRFDTTAKRDPIRERFDLLDPDFLRFMALIGGYGARKYGEKNWQLSRLKEDKSPINHIMKHLVAYQNHERYDHSEIGTAPYIHLAAIAYNAMMEFYHEYKEWIPDEEE